MKIFIMEAILKFNLDDFDDRIAHTRCVKALDMALALWEIRYNFRKNCENYLEHTDKEMDKYEVLEFLMDKLNDVFEENNINVDDLII